MDPDRTLQELRRAVRTWESAPPATQQEAEAANRGMGAASALDDWISGGGFLPREWLTSSNARMDEIERSGD